MTLTQKLEQHMKWMEARGLVVSETSSTRLLQSYYRSIGLTDDTSFGDWMHGVAQGHFPAYGSVTRAIRKARELHPRWKKLRKTVVKQVADVKQEVGYAN